MSPDPSDTPSRAAVEAVWRAESARLIGALVRFVAEDVAQEALLRALARWPAEGIPQRPGAWLMTTAKRVVAALATPRVEGSTPRASFGGVRATPCAPVDVETSADTPPTPLSTAGPDDLPPRRPGGEPLATPKAALFVLSRMITEHRPRATS